MPSPFHNANDRLPAGCGWLPDLVILERFPRAGGIENLYILSGNIESLVFL